MADEPEILVTPNTYTYTIYCLRANKQWLASQKYGPPDSGHVMDLGDRREDIFVNDVDRQDLLKTLAEACQKTGWQVHAYCLMRERRPPCPSSELPPACKWALPEASSPCYNTGYTPMRNLLTTPHPEQRHANNSSSNLRFDPFIDPFMTDCDLAGGRGSPAQR